MTYRLEPDSSIIIRDKDLCIYSSLYSCDNKLATTSVLPGRFHDLVKCLDNFLCISNNGLCEISYVELSIKGVLEYEIPCPIFERLNQDFLNRISFKL